MTMLIKAKRQRQQQHSIANLSDAEMIHNNNNNNNNTSSIKNKNNSKDDISSYNYSTACNMLPTTTTTTTTTNVTSTSPVSGNRLRTHSNAYAAKRLERQDNNKSNKARKQWQRYYSSTYELLQWLIMTVLLLSSFCDDADAALRNVNLLAEPPVVRRGQSIALRCEYSLDGAPLYSIKFYRGQFEFYRFTPGEYPHTKVFQYPGIRVDESNSNDTHVLIRNVGFTLSGNFSCEVTADAPLYSTATAYAHMQVVEFPEKRPQLFTEHTRYEPGDVLRANCSTPPSRPRAMLRFSINNMPVSTEDTQYIRTVDNLIASRLSLKLQLQAVHFATGPTAAAAAAAASVGNNAHLMNTFGPGGGGTAAGAGAGAGVASGALILRCTAQIGDLYQEYKEIELGTPQKDPVPARVTLSSGSGIRNFFETYFAKSAASSPTVLAWQLPWLLVLLLLLVNCSYNGIVQRANNNNYNKNDFTGK